MNITLLSLQLTSSLNSFSPFFTNPCSSIHATSTFKSLFLSYQHNYFYFSSFGSSSIVCDSCKFRKYISSAIRITEKTNEKTDNSLSSINEKKKIFNERILIVKESKAKFVRCVFSECENRDNKNGNGGAIEVTAQFCHLIIIRCGFISCRTKYSGGSVFARCGYVKFNMSCFEDSRSLVNAQSFYVEAASNFSKIDQVIVYLCGPKKVKGQNTLLFADSSFFVRNSNISHNRQLIANCGFSSLNCSQCSIRFCQFESNNGPGLFHITKCGQSDTLEYCSIVSNVGGSSGLFVLNIDTITFAHFSFMRNTFQYFYTIDKAKEVTFLNCIFDKSSDNFENNTNVLYNNCTYNTETEDPYDLLMPIEFRCFALAATDIAYTKKIKLPPPSKPPSPTASPTKTPKATSTSAFSPSVEWYPNGVLKIQFGLLGFSIFIIPLFLIIHSVYNHKGGFRTRS